MFKELSELVGSKVSTLKDVCDQELKWLVREVSDEERKAIDMRIEKEYPRIWAVYDLERKGFNVVKEALNTVSYEKIKSLLGKELDHADDAQYDITNFDESDCDYHEAIELDENLEPIGIDFNDSAMANRPTMF